MNVSTETFVYPPAELVGKERKEKTGRKNEGLLRTATLALSTTR